MMRCLQAAEDSPTQYSSLAFNVLSHHHYYGKNYYDRCRCTYGPCEKWSERTNDKNYAAYRIYDTAAAPTQRPTPAPPSYQKMAYTKIGDGYCKYSKYLDAQVLCCDLDCYFGIRLT